MLRVQRDGGTAFAPTFAPLDIPAQHEPPPMISPLAVGGVFGEMGFAACAAVQMDETIGTLLALAAIATCVQRAVSVEVSPGWVEPLSVWAWSLAESGSRKTHLQRPMLEPFADWQKRKRDVYRNKIAAARALREVSESRIEKLKRDAANAKSVEEREVARKAIEQELELMPDPVYAPRAFTENITSERLVSLLTENRQRIAFWSDEGGQFGILAGLYSGGAANLDAFLKAHDGSPLVTDRQSAAHFVELPALTMSVLMQPGVFADSLRNQRFRHSGLLARPLYAFPASNVGRREVREAACIPEAVRADYAATVGRLMDECSEHTGPPRRIAFDDEGRAAFLAFREINELDMAPDGRLAGLLDWGSKLPGKVARMAGLIEIAQSGLDVAHVTGASLRAAAAIGELLIPHACAVFFGLGASSSHAGPRALLEWIRAREWPEGVPTFSQRDAFRALEHRFSTPADLSAAARVLTSWGVLSSPMTHKPKTGRPSSLWAINPEALA